MPRVKIVGAIAKPPKGGDVAVPAPESSPRSAGLAAAAAAAAAMGAALGLTPTRMAQAQQVAVAAVAAQQAAAATTAATQKTPGSELRPAAGGKRKQPTDPATTSVETGRGVMAKSLATPAPPPAGLASGRRGARVVVQPAAAYGAGKTYDWSDVVAVGQLMQAGKIQLKDLDVKLPGGGLKFKVPRGTMSGWLKDDAGRSWRPRGSAA